MTERTWGRSNHYAKRVWVRLGAGIFLWVCTHIVLAGPFDAMINPGALISGHEKLEKECNLCHKPFRKDAQNRLCMDCHDHRNIANDVKWGKGLHGKNRRKNCRQCHSEHKGRDAKIAQLDKRDFDHSLTEFPLRNKHRAKDIKCKSCHKKGKKYRDVPTKCNSCHRKDDVHKGSLGKVCADCHSDKGWKKVRFDHSKTDYPLTGKHREVKCRDCHKNKDHKKTPKTCYACHRNDDEHRGKYGKKCKSCHTPKDWTISLFNHGRKTDYRLRGAHRKIKCKACHKGNLYKNKQKLKTDCYACHRNDDVHKGQEGKKCEQCHNERRWTQTTFDHGLAKFPLLGKHTRVKCKECHDKQTYKDAPTSCYACHKKDDEHKLRFGRKCGSCHNAREWKYWSFNHNRQTNFKLDGAHRKISCESCHNRPMRKSGGISSLCASCHEKDDIHHGEFGMYCEHCHAATDFKEIRTRQRIH